MNDYSKKINILTGLMLKAEEDDERIELILPSDMAYDIAVELQDELGKRFHYETYQDDFDYLLKNEDILSLSMSRDNRGIIYFLSEVIYKDVTLESVADVFYIHEDVFDKINIKRLFGDIVILKEFGDSDFEEDECDEDCEHCHLHDEKEEELYSDEENIIEVLLGELLDDLSEIKYNDVKSFNIALRNKLTEAYNVGRSDVIDEIREKLYEIE